MIRACYLPPAGQWGYPAVLALMVVITA